MSVLLVGDIHFSDRPPSSCTETYNDDLFDLMYQTVHIAAGTHADLVVWVGDVFHVKAPSRTSHALVQRVIQLLRDYQAPVVIVPGNHDLSNDRLESLDQQPLGTVYKSGAALQPCRPDGCVDAVQLDRGCVKFVPWQKDWGELEMVPECGSDDLVVAHAPLYPPGQELKYEFVPSQTWASRQRDGYCYYGHVHERHGQWRSTGEIQALGGTVMSATSNVLFCNHGAITRGSLQEHDLTRTPAVTLWSAQHGFQEIPLKAKPASEVFRLQEVTEEKDHQQRLDEFLATVSATQLDVLSIESVVAEFKERTDIDEVTKAVVIGLLEQVQ